MQLHFKLIKIVVNQICGDFVATFLHTNAVAILSSQMYSLSYFQLNFIRFYFAKIVVSIFIQLQFYLVTFLGNQIPKILHFDQQFSIYLYKFLASSSSGQTNFISQIIRNCKYAKRPKRVGFSFQLSRLQARKSTFKISTMNPFFSLANFLFFQ